MKSCGVLYAQLLYISGSSLRKAGKFPRNFRTKLIIIVPPTGFDAFDPLETFDPCSLFGDLRALSLDRIGLLRLWLRLWRRRLLLRLLRFRRLLLRANKLSQLDLAQSLGRGPPIG